MKKTKRLLSLLVTLAMVLGLMPGMVTMASTKDETGEAIYLREFPVPYEWTEDDDNSKTYLKKDELKYFKSAAGQPSHVIPDAVKEAGEALFSSGRVSTNEYDVRVIYHCESGYTLENDEFFYVTFINGKYYSEQGGFGIHYPLTRYELFRAAYLPHPIQDPYGKKYKIYYTYYANVEGVTIGNAPETLLRGNTAALSAEITPAEAIDKTITWSSNNTNVIKVDNNGVVTAVAPGSATITLTATNGTADTTDDKSESCVISVPATVTFDTNEGTAIDPQNVVIGECVTKPSDPTREGYTFEGWYTDDDTFNNGWNFNTRISNDMTLHAKWAEIPEVIEYPLWVGGTQVTNQNASNIFNGKASYDLSTNTLTLDKYSSSDKYDVGQDHYNIYYDGDKELNINIKGNNYIKIEPPAGSRKNDNYYGIRTSKGVRFTGDGTLTIIWYEENKATYGIHSGGEIVFVSGTVDITPKYWIEKAVGIHGKSIEIKNATVKVAVEIRDNGYAFEGETINISNQANLTALATTGVGSNIALNTAQTGNSWPQLYGQQGVKIIAAGTSNFPLGSDIKKIQFPATVTGYTLNYVTNGGTEIAEAIVTALPDKLPETTKSGYTFKGWYTDEALNNTAVAGSEITANTTLYAKWETIPAAAPTISSVTDETLTYGYTGGSISVTASAASNHSLSYQWYSNTTNSTDGGTAITSGGTDASYVIPTGKDVGTYHYYCVVTATRKDNNEAQTATSPVATVSVKRADLDAAVTMADYTYGDKPSVPGVSSNPGSGTVTYYYNTSGSNSGGTEWKDITSTTLDAGSYYMYAVIAQTDNYKAKTTEVTSFKVTPAEISITAPSASDINYGQTLSDSTLSGGSAASGGQSVDATFVWADGNVRPAVADSNTTEYTVNVTPASGNYKAATCNVKLAVNPAQLILDTSPSASGIAYGQKLSDSTLSGGKVKTAYEQEITGTFAWAAPDTEPAYADSESTEYTVNFTPSIPVNYDSSALTIPVKLSISKVAPLYNAPTAIENLEYNGDSQALVNSGSATGGTMQYALGTKTSSEGGSWSNDVPKGKDHGTYYVWYKVAGDTNHNDVGPFGPIEVTVSQKTLTPSLTGAVSKVYDGGTSATGATSDTLCIALKGVADSDDVSAAIGSAAYGSANKGTGISVTASNITLTGTQAGNYVLSGSTASANVGEITQRAITITAADQTVELNDSITDYSTTNNLASVTGGDLVGGHTLESIKLESSSTASGTKTGTITPSKAVIKNGSENVTDNYNISYVNGVLNVTKFVPIVDTTVSAGAITYGQTLADSQISGSMKDPKTGNAVSGIFAWDASNTKPSVSDSGTTDYAWTFTPENAAAYEPVKGTLKLTVNPKPAALVWENTELTYNGRAQKPAAAVSNLETGDSCEVTVTGEQTNAGDSYTATAESLSNSNYKLPDNKTTAFKISKANAVPATVTANNRTYDGKEKPLITVDQSVLVGSEMQYALGTATEATQPYTTSIPTATEAGTYYVWYKVEGDDNHIGTEPDKVQVTISLTDKAALNNAIAAAEEYYNSIAGNADYADIAATLKTAIETARKAKDDNTTEKAVADAISALNGAVDTAKADVKKADEKKAAEEKKAADEAAAKKVVDLINALPASAGVGDKEAVKAARDAYDALTDDQKALVDKAKLDAAEAQVQAAEAEAAKQAEQEKEAEAKKAADEAAANSVVDLINALPASAGVGDKEAVEAARAAYDALTDDQKALVPPDVLAKLTAAEDQVQAAEKEAEKQEAEKISIAKCKITAKDRTYTGKAIKPKVTVKYGKKTLKAGTDYTLSYSKKLKDVGKATVTVKGKGKYTGSKKVTFDIIPKGTKFSKLTGGKGQIALQWKKQANITGYQIQYSLKKNFKGADKVNIPKAKTVKTTIGNLKGKKTYYVRIRTYKKVGKKAYYSAWSKAKAVRTKAGKVHNEAAVQDSDAAMNVGEALDLNPLLPVDDVALPGEMEIDMAG